MKKKSILIIVLLLLIIVSNIYVFYIIKEDLLGNTFYILYDFGMGGTEDDIKYINDNYGFWHLQTETNKLKYDLIIKALWTFDLMVIVLIIFASKYFKKSS